MLGCIRAAVQIISYEILMSAIFLILFVITGTTNFEMFIDAQLNYSIFLFMPILGIVCFIATLMETNRPPFDLSEAESDVVAGYTVEYAGIMFGLFYLGEYVNLFTNSFIMVILFGIFDADNIWPILYLIGESNNLKMYELFLDCLFHFSNNIISDSNSKFTRRYYWRRYRWACQRFIGSRNSSEKHS